MVFDKVEEGVLRLLEVFVKTDSGWLEGKLQLYEPSTSFSSGQVQPVHVRFGVMHLVHGQELSSLHQVWPVLVTSVCPCLSHTVFIHQQKDCLQGRHVMKVY